MSISFADAYQSQSSSRYQKTDDSQSFSTQFSESRELSFSMSVNGELNEDEQQAINDLMAELQDVSKTFFSGDLDKAFEQAQELSLGNEQLVAFSMDLRQSKTVAAIKEYEQIKPTSEKAIAETVRHPAIAQLTLLNQHRQDDSRSANYLSRPPRLLRTHILESLIDC